MCIMPVIPEPSPRLLLPTKQDVGPSPGGSPLQEGAAHGRARGRPPPEGQDSQEDQSCLRPRGVAGLRATARNRAAAGRRTNPSWRSRARFLALAARPLAAASVWLGPFGSSCIMRALTFRSSADMPKKSPRASGSAPARIQACQTTGRGGVMACHRTSPFSRSGGGVPCHCLRTQPSVGLLLYSCPSRLVSHRHFQQNRGF